MFIAKKIRLIPTKEQEILFFKSAGVARWAYNYFLGRQEEVYEAYLANNKEGESFIDEGDVRKYINNVLKPTTHTWLKEVGSNVMKQAIKDANNAYQNFFHGIAQKPKFKCKHKETPSFYVNYESLSKKEDGFQGEKLGIVKTVEPLPEIEGGMKYSNPRITYDGKYWYLSVSYEVEEGILEDGAGESIGVDLGIKNLAICSNGRIYKNINKSKHVKKLEKRLKREQRKVSRKLRANTKEYKTVGKKRSPVWKRPIRECKNIQKQNRVIKKLYKRLTDIRNNYLHQTTTEIVKAKPSRIVMESLNVRGMMKNKHLSKQIAEQKFYEFKRQVKYKSALRGIEFVEVDKWYPSSKKCSRCGNIKSDLKLKDRVYKCEKCGLTIDRDYNASLNLATYQLA